MLNVVWARLKQGHRTSGFPKSLVKLPARFRGRPRIDANRCKAGCQTCVAVCPTRALSHPPLAIDLGQCLFCGRCEEVCTDQALAFTGDYRLATSGREDLIVRGGEERMPPLARTKLGWAFARSLKLRQVSAGGCNGCEAELVALGNVVFDLGRFGISFVASPRHADGLVVTGPVTTNMQLALRQTYEAVPSPKVVIAVGACAISGGAFAGADAASDGIPRDPRVDLFVPGCPPHPLTILDALLRFMGRL